MIPFPQDKKYNIIYADPAWDIQTGNSPQRIKKGLKEIKDIYPTMSNQEIINLPVKDLAADDCILFLWMTDDRIPIVKELFSSWGFTYKTCGFTWVKVSSKGNIFYNLSRYTLKSTELCFIGIKGKLKNLKKSHKIKNLVFAERTVHSKKPDIIRKQIEEFCFDLPRIELFARQKTDGWDVWGNEV